MKSAQKPLVLVVDDDQWMAESHLDHLTQAGFQVATASDVLEAIDRITEKPPDVIVLDIFLPGANGLSLLHDLQSYSDTSTIPVIICSGAAESINPADLKPYGVARLLDKVAMTPADLVASVRSLIS